MARYGGEEFAIVLPQTDGRNARIVAERIRKATETTSFVLTEGTVRMTVSIVHPLESVQVQLSPLHGKD